MLFRLLPVPLCVMKVLMHVYGLSKWTNPWSRYAHTQSFLSCSSADFSSLRRRDGVTRWVGVWAHTQTPSQAAGVCVCSGWFRAGFRCLAYGHWAHREGGAGAPTSRLGQRVNTHTIRRFCMRNQCEFGKLHKSILVDLNNWIMISRNGHDMGPLTLFRHAGLKEPEQRGVRIWHLHDLAF